MGPASKPFGCLPTSVTPRKYFLDYHVDLAHYRFEVAQKIDMDGALFGCKYVQENWVALNAQYSPLMVDWIVLSVISRFHSEEKAVEVAAFMQTRKHSLYERLLNASLERICIKSASYQCDRDELAKWLNASISA